LFGTNIKTQWRSALVASVVPLNRKHNLYFPDPICVHHCDFWSMYAQLVQITEYYRESKITTLGRAFEKPYQVMNIFFFGVWWMLLLISLVLSRFRLEMRKLCSSSTVARCSGDPNDHLFSCCSSSFWRQISFELTTSEKGQDSLLHQVAKKLS
jgi:hypothetical protein